MQELPLRAYLQKLGELMNGNEIVVGKVFGGLILPRRMERYVYGVGPYFKRGNNIRTQRIAYHQQLLRLYFQAIAQITECLRRLIRYDVRRMEIPCQARSLQFVLLIKQLSFRKYCQPVRRVPIKMG